jgi:ATP-dependent RNA helicase HelY
MTTPLSGQLADFTGQLSFNARRFSDALPARALEDGHGVLVCAPTGGGQDSGGGVRRPPGTGGGPKCFYTTPIKALSNQKPRDLVRRYGPEAHSAADRRPVDQRRSRRSW